MSISTKFNGQSKTLAESSDIPKFREWTSINVDTTNLSGTIRILQYGRFCLIRAILTTKTTLTAKTQYAAGTLGEQNGPYLYTYIPIANYSGSLLVDMDKSISLTPAENIPSSVGVNICGCYMGEFDYIG